MKQASHNSRQLTVNTCGEMKIRKLIFTLSLFGFGLFPKVDCFAESRNIESRQVVVGSSFACMSMGDNNTCWGYLGGVQSFGLIPVNFPNLVQISAGISSMCALFSDQVQCWGTSGPSMTRFESPHNLNHPRRIAVGFNHGCAIDETGVTCWGDNEYGQLNVPELQNPRKIVAGFSHSCALDDNGVTCWGGNDLLRNPPMLENPVDIAAGYEVSCAQDDSGIHCWGAHGSALLNVPQNLVTPQYLTMIANHACVLDENTVKCWGDSNAFANPPVLNHPTQIVTGQFNTCAVDDHHLKCWGRDNFILYPPRKLINPREVSSGRHTTCALDDHGMVCWGDVVGEFPHPVPTSTTMSLRDPFWLLSNGQIVWPPQGWPHPNPQQLSAVTKLECTDMSISRNICCSLDASGGKCWSDGTIDIPGLQGPHDITIGVRDIYVLDDLGVHYYELDSNSPNGLYVGRVSDIHPNSIVSNLNDTLCALYDDSLSCSGGSDNSLRNLSISNLRKPRNLSIGFSHGCFIDDDGVHCFGRNQFGQTEVPAGLQNPRWVNASFDTSCAIDNSGVQCWGNNEHGQLRIAHNLPW